MLLYLPGRKTDQTGYGTMLSRWRSGDSLCPVSTLAEYCEKERPSNAPLFPLVTRHALRAFLRDEMAVQGIRDGGLRSPRRGGAAHLKVHLEDDTAGSRTMTLFTQGKYQRRHHGGLYLQPLASRR